MSTFTRVTIRDIADRLKVSHATVSLALRNHPRISKKRREQVQASALEMGYRPDPILSSLVVYRQSSRKTPIHSAIAWINYWEHPESLRKIREFNSYWTGASAAAEKFGYHLEEFVWKPSITPQRLETILQTRNVRGVLIPPHPTQPKWGGFRWEKFSVIRFGMSVPDPDSHIVTSDHLRSVVTAVEKIHDHGYNRIGLVVPGELDAKVGGGYTGGYIAAQNIFELKNKLPPLLSEVAEKAHSKQFKEWFNKNKPDAILTGDPLLVKTLKELNIRVPEDVAVAATTISDIAVDAGINQNSEEIGRVAVEMLVSLINCNDLGRPTIPRRILVEGFWNEGKSLPRLNLAEIRNRP